MKRIVELEFLTIERGDYHQTTICVKEIFALSLVKCRCLIAKPVVWHHVADLL